MQKSSSDCQLPNDATIPKTHVPNRLKKKKVARENCQPNDLRGSLTAGSAECTSNPGKKTNHPVVYIWLAIWYPAADTVTAPAIFFNGFENDQHRGGAIEIRRRSEKTNISRCRAQDTGIGIAPNTRRLWSLLAGWLPDSRLGWSSIRGAHDRSLLKTTSDWLLSLVEVVLFAVQFSAFSTFIGSVSKAQCYS